MDTICQKEPEEIALQTLSDRIADAREFWAEALDMERISFPYEDQIRRHDPAEGAAAVVAAIKKHDCAAHLERCRALYFGVYEIDDSLGLSGKILYLSGMDRPAPEFTPKTMVWKPRWGRFRPALFKMIARIEDGIDPSKKLKPPLKVEEEFCGSTVTVLDFNAANPDLESVDLDRAQKQHLNYYVTFVSAIAIVKSALPDIPFKAPIWTGFDDGDIIRLQ